MLSSIVTAGMTLELQQVKKVQREDEPKPSVYKTKVYDIISEDRLEVYMPIEKSKLILLPQGSDYSLVFYTEQGLYQCLATVVDRYKNDRSYVVMFELRSNLIKYQRREFYRYNCTLEMHSRSLEKEEITALEQNVKHIVPGLPLKRSIVVDISGGGLRFVSNYPYEIDSLIWCKYHLDLPGGPKEYTSVGKVLGVRELEEVSGRYEHRVQFVNIDPDEREEIVRYIFEEERKSRRREKRH